MLDEESQALIDALPDRHVGKLSTRIDANNLVFPDCKRERANWLIRREMQQHKQQQKGTHPNEEDTMTVGRCLKVEKAQGDEGKDDDTKYASATPEIATDILVNKILPFNANCRTTCNSLALSNTETRIAMKSFLDTSIPWPSPTTLLPEKLFSTGHMAGATITSNFKVGNDGYIAASFGEDMVKKEATRFYRTTVWNCRTGEVGRIPHPVRGYDELPSPRPDGGYTLSFSPANPFLLAVCHSLELGRAGDLIVYDVRNVINVKLCK